jgi:hypothetical protein
MIKTKCCFIYCNRSCTLTFVCFYTVFKPDDSPCRPKHVAEYALQLRCIDCILDYLHHMEKNLAQYQFIYHKSHTLAWNLTRVSEVSGR